MRIKRDGISAVKFEAAQFHFLSDVFIVVPLSLLKFPKTVGFMQLLAPGAAQTGLCIVLLNLKLKKRLKHHGDSPSLNFIRLLRVVITPSVREGLEAIGWISGYDSPNFWVNVLLELSRWIRWLEMCMVFEQQKKYWNEFPELVATTSNRFRAIISKYESLTWRRWLEFGCKYLLV